jgi:anti-sigma regulatory factor (Ser/Thr protein kinase)
VCRVANAEFGAASTSSASARHFVTDLLDRWELPSLIEDAELLTGELVNNAIGHASAHSSIDLALVVAVAEGILEIGVTDSDPQSIRFVQPKGEDVDVEARDEALAEGGRGLLLVGLLADEWGVVGLPQGKQVWFRLSTNDWSYNSACPCHGDDLDRVRLESGRYALAVAGPWDSATGSI